MTSPEFGGIQPRPEFDDVEPTELFTNALARWKRNERIVAEERRGEEQARLVAKLNDYIHQKFGRLPEQLPEVTVEAEEGSVFHTLGHSNPASGIDALTSGEYPLQGDDTILGKHNLHGTLQMFYISKTHLDLRIYVSGASDPMYMDGGIYVPLLSVPVEGSDIQFTKYTTEQKIKELGEYIYEQSSGYNDDVKGLVRLWKSLMKAPNESITSKLKNTSIVIGEIDKHEETSGEFVDSLLEVMNLQFGLESPHAIKANAHRIRIPQGFLPGGPKLFENVTPNLSLMGESILRRKLGVTFQHDTGLIEIPAEQIEVIYKSK